MTGPAAVVPELGGQLLAKLLPRPTFSASSANGQTWPSPRKPKVSSRMISHSR